MSASPVSTGIQSLPAELVVQIFSEFSPKELAICSLVNKLWHASTKMDPLWAAFCRKDRLPPPPEGSDAKSHYISFSPHAIKQKGYKKHVTSHPDLIKFFQRISLEDPPVWHQKEICFLGRSNYVSGAHLWDIETGKCVLSKERVTKADFNESVLITAHNASERLEIREWNKANGKCRDAYRAVLSLPECMLLHEKELCIATREGITVIDREHSKIVATFARPNVVGPRQQWFFCISRQDSLFLTASKSGICLWDLRTYEPVTVIKEVYAKKLLLQQETLIGDYGGGFKLFDIRTGGNIYTSSKPGIDKGDRWFVESPQCQIDLQGTILAQAWDYTSELPWFSSPVKESKISLMDLETQTELSSFSAEKQFCRAIQWNDSSIVGLTKEGKIVTWAPRTGLSALFKLTW